MDRGKHVATCSKVGTADMTEVTHPTLDLCLKEASALTATHLKGLKSQCRDRLSME